MHVPNFGGFSGSEERVGVTTVSNSLSLGGWVTKSFKEWRQKIGGGRVDTRFHRIKGGSGVPPAPHQ